MSKVVGLTGISGHLGSNLARALLKQGYPVRALARSESEANQGLDLDLVIGDVLDDRSLANLLAGCDVVIHCAAVISIDGDRDGRVQQTNVEGTRKILEAAVNARIGQFIYVSSTHAVIENLGYPVYNEENLYKTRKNFAYDWSKSQAEQLVREAFRTNKISGSIVRPSSLLGPPDFKPSKLGQAILDLYEGKIPVLPPGGYNFVDVRDVAAAIVSCLERGRKGEVYLLSGKYYDMQVFAGLIKSAGGKNSPKIRMSFGLMYFLLPFVRLWAGMSRSEAAFTKEMLYALKNGHPNMDNSKAIKELGLEVRPLEDSIKDYIDWQKERGRL